MKTVRAPRLGPAPASFSSPPSPHTAASAAPTSIHCHRSSHPIRIAPRTPRLREKHPRPPTTMKTTALILAGTAVAVAQNLSGIPACAVCPLSLFSSPSPTPPPPLPSKPTNTNRAATVPEHRHHGRGLRAHRPGLPVRAEPGRHRPGRRRLHHRRLQRRRPEPRRQRRRRPVRAVQRLAHRQPQRAPVLHRHRLRRHHQPHHRRHHRPDHHGRHRRHRAYCAHYLAHLDAQRCRYRRCRRAGGFYRRRCCPVG